MERIAIRELTEEEARAHTGIAPPRFAIVDADRPERGLYYAGMLGRPEGADWLHVTILTARRWERKRGYKLVLTHEQAMIERVGKIIDFPGPGFGAWPHERDGAECRAKLEAVARAVVPEAYMPRESDARRKRERREREDARREGVA